MSIGKSICVNEQTGKVRIMDNIQSLNAGPEWWTIGLDRYEWDTANQRIGKFVKRVFFPARAGMPDNVRETISHMQDRVAMPGL